MVISVASAPRRCHAGTSARVVDGPDPTAVRTALRRALHVEVDARPQDSKQRRLAEEGYPVTQHFVPVDLESGQSWREELQHNGFDATAPAVFSSSRMLSRPGRRVRGVGLTGPLRSPSPRPR
jgi:hypothetical protein